MRTDITEEQLKKYAGDERYPQMGSMIQGVWFISYPDGLRGMKETNWLAMIWMDPEKGVRGSYRFRYCRDERIHDHEDKFSWYIIDLTEEVSRPPCTNSSVGWTL